MGNVPRNRALSLSREQNIADVNANGGHRMLIDKFPNGAWEGKRCFVIGGGPSLTGFDFSRLDNELVLGVNRSYEFIDPTIQVSIDDRFIGWADTGHFGPDALAKWQSLTATKCFVHYTWTGRTSKDHYFVPCNRTEGFSFDLRALGHTSNSGYTAMNIACCLRAKEVYLLGFDMKAVDENGKKKEWFHSGYSLNRKRDPYPIFTELFYKHAEAIRAGGVHVLNCNPDSALRCFDFCNVDDILPVKQKPIWFAYCTEGSGYQKEAERLKKSLVRFNQPHFVKTVPSLGSWQKNTQLKACLMRDMVAENQGNTIIYTDSDSELRAEPTLFSRIPEDVDIAFHMHRGIEFLSGTLFVRCNPVTIDLMNDWIKECSDNPEKWDQQCLFNAVRRSKAKTYILPAEYCCIFDAHPEIKNPVVVHYQASRRLKKEVNQR